VAVWVVDDEAPAVAPLTSPEEVAAPSRAVLTELSVLTAVVAVEAVADSSV